jgi:hypothetical protein
VPKVNVKEHVREYHPGMGQIKPEVFVDGKIFYYFIVKYVVVLEAAEDCDQQINNVDQDKENNIHQDNTRDHISVVKLSFQVFPD